MAIDMTRPWLKAIVICAILSAVFTLGASILFGGGASYPPEIEWQRVNEMKYREAEVYLSERAKRMSGWETFIQGIQSPLYWKHIFYGWLASFVFALVCCSGLLWWLGITRTPSNPTPHADAREPTGSEREGAARAGERER